ncbi:hypothetical protein PR202_ga12545 [Eleusine coracana subsp. coracana]|uniref:K+ potassium transporter integral membrane domain-containing protein n=1 Tax=Eleusine coracana subsp. coracana TaxID=191504 RepID=A0AAV5CBS9_ELECO|nr:hypothetical protein PR202_ga12545 [Eleusine coracana subsp. coracana]
MAPSGDEITTELEVLDLESGGLDGAVVVERQDSLFREVVRGEHHGGGAHSLNSLIPNQQAEDELVSRYNRRGKPSATRRRARWLKNLHETSKSLKLSFFFLTMLAIPMVISDAVLTPPISVLSAVSGLKEKVPSLTTGSEARFANLGYFSIRSIQITTIIGKAHGETVDAQSVKKRQQSNERVRRFRERSKSGSCGKENQSAHQCEIDLNVGNDDHVDDDHYGKHQGDDPCIAEHCDGYGEVDSEEGKSGGSRKYVAAREYYCYKLQNHNGF